MKLLVLIVCTILSVACTSVKPSPVSCDQILDARIAATNWDKLDKTNIHEWVKKNYAGSSIRVIADNTFGWKSGKTEYIVTMNPTLERVKLFELDPRPSLRDVIACFGNPKWYEAKSMPTPETAGVGFNVWYPEKGLLFAWQEAGNWIRTEFTEDTEFRTLILTKSGTLDEQVEKIAGKAFKVDAMKTIKPWSFTAPFKIKAN